jgi:hypothetical protein
MQTMMTIRDDSRFGLMLQATGSSAFQSNCFQNEF